MNKIKTKFIVDNKTISDIYFVLTNGFYYYNRLGKVYKFNNCKISAWDNEIFVEGKISNTVIRFSFNELNKKWFISEKNAIYKANEYLNDINKTINISTLQKIIKLKYGDTIFVKNDTDFVKNDTEIYERELEGNVFYDKYKKVLIECYEIDDDYYYKSIENKYKIRDYGKTWALTEKELKK